MSKILEKYKANIVAEYNYNNGSLSDIASSNDGTATGSPVWVNSPKGKGLKLNGSTQYVNLGTGIASAVTGSNVTVLAVAKYNDVDANDNGIFKHHFQNATAGGFSLDVDNGTNIRFLTTNSTGTAIAVYSYATADIEGKTTYFTGTYADGVATLYLNGLSVGTGTTGSGNITYSGTDTSANIGREPTQDSDYLNGVVYKVIILKDVSLSPMEIAQWYAEEKQSGHYDRTPTKTFLSEGEIEKSVVSAWNMNINNGTVLDIGANSNNATVVGNIKQVDGVFGKAIDCDGSNAYLTIPDDASLQTLYSTGGSLECWLNIRSDGESSLGRIYQKGGSYLIKASEAAGFIKLNFRKQFSGDDGIWITDNAVVPLNTPTHIIVAYDSSSTDNNPTIYINGVGLTVAAGLTESVTPTGTADADAGIMYIGNYSALDVNFDGSMDMIKFHNIKFNDMQAVTQYEKAKSKLNYYADGKDWNESVANESTGYLSNTDWELNGVNTTIEDNGSGDGTKRITTSTGGTQGSRPSTQAFGTWECKMNREFANFCTLIFIHDTKHGALGDANSYNISYRDDGTVRLRRASTVIVEDTTTRGVGVEVTIKVTRTLAGQWELFVDGVSAGTGLDATYTSSAWCVLDMDDGTTLRDFKFSPIVQ